ncbi:relaxase/mobilization nuclease domain-containing protein [Klebsiella oxytoca]
MKGNVAKTGRSFKNRVEYILKDDHDFICSNMSADKNNVSDLTDEFKTVSSFRQDIKKPVFHAFLSLPKNEKLTDEKWEEIAKDYLKEMNIDIEKHQYICVRHKDTDKEHIHIVANRVGLDGSVWHGQHSAFNTIAACERLEIKHGLTITKGLKGQKSDVSAPTKNEIEQALRTGEKPARLVLQNALQAVLVDKPDLSTFVERLQAVGIEPAFNVASTGNVAGVSFGIKNNEKNIYFKGSQLGKKYSWNTIKAKVKYDKNRDDELVRRFAARKADDENSIRRSLVEPNINDSRAIIRINDDSLGISQHSIESDEGNNRKSKQLIRENNKNVRKFESFDKRFNTAKQSSKTVLDRVKNEYHKESNIINNKNSFNIKHDQFSGSSISNILNHAEASANAVYHFKRSVRGKLNSRTAQIEALREKLGIQKQLPDKTVSRTVQIKTKIVEEVKKAPETNYRFKSRLQSQKQIIQRPTEDLEQQQLEVQQQHRRFR